MHNVLSYLGSSTFPAIRRKKLEVLQVNLGYLCNLSCVHCHVSAGPNRTEVMNSENVDVVLRYLDASMAQTLDLTGGAPEMNKHFRRLVIAARERNVNVIDRCNLTILQEPGYQDLAEFLATQHVTVVASLPCYMEENVDAQRGNGVFTSSIAGLKQLNAFGYGIEGSGLSLDLMYNPQGATLPPAQTTLEVDYKKHLDEQYGVRFNRLMTLTNMPIGRFGSILVSKKQITKYLALLHGAHNENNLENVMCRYLISVDWQGYVYDCDFNQILGLPLRMNNSSHPKHLSELLEVSLEEQPITVRNHCYGCTAGSGSSCSGSFEEAHA